MCWWWLLMTMQKFSFTPFLGCCPEIFVFKLEDRIHITSTESKMCLGFLYLSQGDDSLTQLTTYLTTQDVGLRGLCAMLRHFAGQVPLKNCMKICEQRDLHCHPFPFYLWRFDPPKSWTPCRNKLMKCLSLRVHLLDHLANISPFRKGRDAEQSGPKIVDAHPSKWPQKGQKLNCWCSITGGDGFFESYAILCKVELVMVVYVASHAARWYRTEDLLGPYLCSGHCRMTCRWGSINIIITRGISFTRWIHSRNIQPNLFWFFTRFQLCLIISYTFSTQQSCEGAYCFQSSTFAQYS